MGAQETFTELRTFWREAYTAAKFSTTNEEDFHRSCLVWLRAVLDKDADHGGELVCLDDRATTRRAPFTARLPEPFFGRWCDEQGQLQLRGKTVVVLINPGSGIEVQQYLDPRLSKLGRPLHEVYRDFYVNGSVPYGGENHALLYKRKLAPLDHPSVNGGRRFAWGWWQVQFPNMMRSLGIPENEEEEEEEDHFVTLELFAYSSRSAGHLNVRLVEKLRSSRLAVNLIRELAGEPGPNAPKRIVLVGKCHIWKAALNASGASLMFTRVGPPKNDGTARAFRVTSHGQECPVPVRALNGSSMRFPTAEVGAQIFTP